MQVPTSKQQQLQQSLPQQLHSTATNHPQFQINKAYNVVSILKTSRQQVNTSQPVPVNHLGQSHHKVHQLQNYPQNQAQHNCSSRTQQSQQQQQHTVICSGGNIMTVNELYNLSGHRSSRTGIIDPCRVSDLSKASNSVANQQQQQQQETNGACIASNGSKHSGSSIITLRNSHGITLGTSSSGTSTIAIHDKGLLRVNVCVDSRKYDNKNNNLLSNSSFQAAQEVGPKIGVKSNKMSKIT